MNTPLLPLLKQAIAGDQTAQQNLLQSFQTQQLSESEQEEVHIYLKQASKDRHEAIYLRGLLYSSGYGVQVDNDMAFLLMREAAAKGNSHAIYEVGHRFLIGAGVPQNYVSALQWLTTAAASPHYIHEAMLDLSRMYEEGLGVEIDKETAQSWYQKSQS